MLVALHKWLSGAPGSALSAVLIGIAIIAAVAALIAPAELKLLLVAWLIAP